MVQEYERTCSLSSRALVTSRMYQSIVITCHVSILFCQIQVIGTSDVWWTLAAGLPANVGGSPFCPQGELCAEYFNSHDMTRQGRLILVGCLWADCFAQLLHEGYFSYRWEFEEVGHGGMIDSNDLSDLNLIDSWSWLVIEACKHLADVYESTKATNKTAITSPEGEALAANVEGTPLPILTLILVPGLHWIQDEVPAISPKKNPLSRVPSFGIIWNFKCTKTSRVSCGCFQNRGTPKWMVYNGKPH